MESSSLADSKGQLKWTGFAHFDCGLFSCVVAVREVTHGKAKVAVRARDMGWRASAGWSGRESRECGKEPVRFNERNLAGSRPEVLAGHAIISPARARGRRLRGGQAWGAGRWEPNQAGLARSTSLRPADGSFPSVVPPVDGTGGSTTYDSQPTYVLPFPCDNGRTVLIYMGDRWNVRGPGGVRSCPLPLCLSPLPSMHTSLVHPPHSQQHFHSQEHFHAH